MASLSIRCRQRRGSAFRRQASAPEAPSPSAAASAGGAAEGAAEPADRLKRAWSTASLLQELPRLAADNGQGIYRFFKREMFNVLFSLAKDNVAGPGTPISSPASSSRDGLLTTIYKQHRTRARLVEPYRRIKNALKKMQEDYHQSKGANLFLRYSHMQHMVHEVVLLEKQYWQLIDLPAQEVSETPNAYVLRLMQLLDERGAGAAPPAAKGGIASLLSATMNLEKTKDQCFHEHIRAMSTDGLRKECDQLYRELYKLIRKYQNLRSTLQDLADAYQDSRFFPILPRYYLLKNMIKRVLRAPAFAEICHEASEF